MFLSFSENISIFPREILYRCSWYYSHYTNFFFHIILKEKFLYCRPFWGILGYFFHEILYRCSRYYSGVTTLKRFFLHDLAPSFCLGHFGVCPRFLENRSIFPQEILCRCSWYYSDSYKTCFFTSCPPLLRAIWGRYFGLILGIFFHVLRKFQYILMIFCAEPLFNALIVTKQDYGVAPSRLGHFWSI